ncbi:MAG: hypothetical protein JWN40_4176 [Phycisphaerales bacterium]|nr:hypothetical protein [Phycisphaerales bacterium]
MKLVNRSTVATLGVIWALACASSSTLQAAPPAKPGVSPVQPGIVALMKEYQEAMKKNGEGLREKSDYYATNKPEGVTTETILAALEKPIGTDQRAEAYVKWQLLSGVESKFPDELKARALRVYRNAPPPSRHPGADHSDLDRRLRKIGMTNPDNEVPVNTDLGEAIKQYRLAIEPTLSYRDELYSRMPPGYETLAAALSDTYDRVSRGAPATEFWKNLMGSIRSWALASSDSAHMREMAGAVNKLYMFVKDDRNKPYYRVIWLKTDKELGLRWQSQSTIDQEKYIDELAAWLDEHAKNPAAGGLNFKDPADAKKK